MTQQQMNVSPGQPETPRMVVAGQSELLHAERRLGKDRNLITPPELFRGAELFVGTIASGAHLSGGGTTIKSVSSPVNIRMLNLDIANRENNWIEVEFRDGGFAGGRVLGPYRIEPYGERHYKEDLLKGRLFTSSVYAMVYSGGAGQPLNSGFGVLVNIGVWQEPTDVYGV